MKEPGVLISLRMPRELWSQINYLVESNENPDFSHAARSLIEAGLWLLEHKKDLTDPEKSQQVIEEYNSKIKEDTLFDWTAQLTDMQIEGMQDALEIEREKRIKKI